MFHKCREYVAHRMNSIYIGWSNDYDSQFDDTAKYFALIDENNIVAACKIIFKNENKGFPLSKAIPRYGCNFNFENFDAEVGGLAFENLTAVKSLFHRSSIFFLKNAVGDILTCYDISNPLSKRLYTGSFGLNFIENAIVRYDDFRHKKNNKAVEWQLLIDKKETRPIRINKFNTRQGILSLC